MLELARLADEHAARTAIEADGVRLGYAELAARVAEVRAGLASRGVAPGERVALVCEPTLEGIVRALAFATHGACCLLLDAAAAPAEAARYAACFRARWLARAGGALAELPGAAPAAGAAQALLSSGSSGTPKIVLRSAAQVTARIANHTRTLGLCAEDRVLGLITLGHGNGFNAGLLGTLSVGGCFVLPASRHPRDVVDEIQAREIRVFSAPPVFLDLMARFAEAPLRLSGLRACLSVGESLPLCSFEAFAERFGVPPWQSYGASEVGPMLLNRNGVACDGALALGRPYLGVEVALCDERGEPVAGGEVGEIVARSAALALGYDGDPGGPSRIERGRFVSGDLAVRRAGELYFVGRKKLLIAVAGRKVSPEEVENVLRRHPAVADAAVLARRSGGFDGVAALVVVRRPVPAAELIGFCAGALAPHKLPRAVEFRDALPRGASGKLLREQLG
jgi:long-chain acyl-CoA synthetase